MNATNSNNSRPGRRRPLWWVGEPHPVYDHMRDPFAPASDAEPPDDE